jgi:hypothetical protein
MPTTTVGRRQCGLFRNQVGLNDNGAVGVRQVKLRFKVAWASRSNRP